MSNIANMFSVLNLDAEDDREEVEKAAPSKPEAAVVAPKPGNSPRSPSPQLVDHIAEKLYRT